MANKEQDTTHSVVGTKNKPFTLTGDAKRNDVTGDQYQTDAQQAASKALEKKPTK